MMCVVNFVLPFSQLQGVEWGWPRGDNFFLKFSFTCISSLI